MHMFLGSRLLATARGVFLAHARRFFDSKTCRADQALRRFLGQNITHLSRRHPLRHDTCCCTSNTQHDFLAGDLASRRHPPRHDTCCCGSDTQHFFLACELASRRQQLRHDTCCCASDTQQHGWQCNNTMSLSQNTGKFVKKKTH